MTVAAIKEKLHDYISGADDKKVKALYTLLEGQIDSISDWSGDKEFVAELNNRYKRWEEGIDPAYTPDEAKSFLNQQRKDRHVNIAK